MTEVEHNLYGISVNPYGVIIQQNFPDIIERKIAEQNANLLGQQFITGEIQDKKALRELNQMQSQYNASQPRNVGSGKQIFRVKRTKKSYGGNYL